MNAVPPGVLRRIGCTALGATLYSLASPPTAWGAACAWVALVPLLAALEHSTARQGFWLGWTFGLLNMLALAAVIVPVPGVRAQHVLVPCAILAIYPALWSVAVVASRGALRSSCARDGFALAAWVLLDYARANAGFLAFPAGTLAQTQVGNLPLIQLAAVCGEYGVTMLVVLGNLAVWRLIRREPWRGVALRVAPVLLCIVAGSVVIAWQEPEPLPRSVRMSALQSAFPRFGTGQVPEEEQDQVTLEQLTRRASSAVHVLVTPETSFINLAAKPTLLTALQALANEHDVSMIVGVAQAAKFDPDSGSNPVTNRRVRAGVWIFRPGAAAPERYDKVLRVPFREYLPFAREMPWPKWLVGTPMEVMRGPRPRTYELPLPSRGRVNVGAIVCWEGLFAAHAGRLTREGAQILVQVANEGWFPHTNAGARHNAAVRLRAVENRRWVVIASNAGPSEIVDAHGRVVAQGGTAQAIEWISANVQPRSDLTLYARIGDWWLLVFAIVCAAVLSAPYVGMQADRRLVGEQRERDEERAFHGRCIAKLLRSH